MTKTSKIELMREILSRSGYEYFPEWFAWVKPLRDIKTGKKTYRYLPGFGPATITALQISNTKVEERE